MRHGSRLPPRPSTVAQSFERWCEAWSADQGALPDDARDAFYAGALTTLSALFAAAQTLPHAEVVETYRSLERECLAHFVVTLEAGKPS